MDIMPLWITTSYPPDAPMLLVLPHAACASTGMLGLTCSAYSSEKLWWVKVVYATGFGSGSGKGFGLGLGLGPGLPLGLGMGTW